MRCFYIGQFLPQHRTECYVKYALEQNGVDVVNWHLGNTDHYSTVQEAAQKIRPDFILFSKQFAGFFPQLIEWAKQSGIPTVCWQWDLFIGYRSGPLPRHFAMVDLLLTTDGGHDHRWQEFGINHKVLRQGIHMPEARMLHGHLRNDLAFFGHLSSNRPRFHLMRFLKHRLPHTLLHTHVRGLSLNKALAETKIVIGDTYPSKNYWSNRVYEITGRGGFLMMPETEGLDQEYTDGVHYASYKRVTEDGGADLLQKIDHYLNDDTDRNAIRTAGFLHTVDNYTYTGRVHELLGHVRDLLGARVCKS